MKASVPREWLVPRRSAAGDLHDPTRRPEFLGNHRGKFTVFNIQNPEPGYLYYHARKDQFGGEVVRFLMDGWEVVDPAKGHRERLVNPFAGMAPFGQNAGTNMSGGLSATPEHILMRIHEEHYRPVADTKLRKNKAQLEAADQQVIERGNQLAEQVGERAGLNRGPLIYPRSGHGYARE